MIKTFVLYSILDVGETLSHYCHHIITTAKFCFHEYETYSYETNGIYMVKLVFILTFFFTILFIYL